MLSTFRKSQQRMSTMTKETVSMEMARTAVKLMGAILRPTTMANKRMNTASKVQTAKKAKVKRAKMKMTGMTTTGKWNKMTKVERSQIANMTRDVRTRK